MTGKQAGNWFVWTDSSDVGNTTYVRWSHTLQTYTQTFIADGSQFVAMSYCGGGKMSRGAIVTVFCTPARSIVIL
jgi:hypothetical protein